MTHPNYENDEFWIHATDIPDDLKLALADFIINFGRLEIAIDQLIWWAIGINTNPVGKALTARLDIRPKCEMALAVLDELEDRRFHDEFSLLAKKIRTVSTRRNAVVHGWWIAIGEYATAMSIRAKLDEPGALLGGTTFKVSDLQNDAKTTKDAERTILKMINTPAPSLRKHEH